MKPILVLNGPNLNLLGSREPEIYGPETLADVDALCAATAQSAGHAVRCHQSNREYELIDLIHAARKDASAIIINPGAFTHTSVAILDALSAFEGPVIVGAYFQHPQARTFPPSFLCLGARRCGDRRGGRSGLRFCGDAGSPVAGRIVCPIGQKFGHGAGNGP